MKKSISNLWTGLAALVFFFSTLVHAHAIEIKEVVSPKGVKALLVEDYTLPIIAMSFSFEGGSTQDPSGKEGTVRMLSALMDEGAGDMDSATFRARLEELGVEIGFSASSDRFGGSMRTLASEKENAFELLRKAVNEPRFDQSAIERMRDALVLSVVRSETNPSSVSRKRVREILFPGHQYSRPSSGTEESLKAIVREDILNMHGKLFARAELKIGVVGAISPEELGAALDKVFGDLSEKPQLVAVADVDPVLGKAETIDMPVPNASITLVYKGLKREDPDFFAAHLMNHILGGGTFSSRLYKEVREKRGLAYGSSSGIATNEHTAYLIAGTSTRDENRDQVLQIMKDEVRKIAEGQISQEELDAAKRFVKGSYAINNLDTSGKIARVLVALQTENLGIDYIDRREELIDAVTLEDVHRVAKELLSVKPTLVTVGPATQ